jgi:hypothetical protein
MTSWKQCSREAAGQKRSRVAGKQASTAESQHDSREAGLRQQAGQHDSTAARQKLQQQSDRAARQHCALRSAPKSALLFPPSSTPPYDEPYAAPSPPPSPRPLLRPLSAPPSAPNFPPPSISDEHPPSLPIAKPLNLTLSDPHPRQPRSLAIATTEYRCIGPPYAQPSAALRPLRSCMQNFLIFFTEYRYFKQNGMLLVWSLCSTTLSAPSPLN